MPKISIAPPVCPQRQKEQSGVEIRLREYGFIQRGIVLGNEYGGDGVGKIKSLGESMCMNNEEKWALWDSMENYLQSALIECKSILPSEDVDEVIEKIDNREYLIALQSLSYKNIKFPKAASKYIKKAAVAMKINEKNDDDYWLWEKIEPLLEISPDVRNYKKDDNNYD